jgi:hypothetical protein
VTGDSIQDLKDTWVYLSPDEAHEILAALQHWANEDEGFRGPGWHLHITEGDRELTLAIDPGDDGRNYASPS